MTQMTGSFITADMLQVESANHNGAVGSGGIKKAQTSKHCKAGIGVSMACTCGAVLCKLPLPLDEILLYSCSVSTSLFFFTISGTR